MENFNAIYLLLFANWHGKMYRIDLGLQDIAIIYTANVTTKQIHSNLNSHQLNEHYTQVIR